MGWILVVLMTSFPVGLPAAEISPRTIPEIVSEHKLVVALYYKDVFPFYFHDQEGKLVGYDVEMARRIAEKLGVEPLFNREARTFDGIIETIAAGRADIAVSLLSITLKRAKKVLFTKPYLVLHPVIILNRLQINDFKYVTGGSVPGIVGVKQGTSYVNFSRTIFSNPQVQAFEAWSKAISELLEGKIFAILRDEVGVNNLFMSDPSLSIKLKTLTLDDFNDNIAIAVNQNNRHLHYWLNLFLETYKNEQSIEKIILQYKKFLPASEK